MKTFIYLDISLNLLNILTQYTDRWAIEPFFRDCKSCLGLDGYQVRSDRSSRRYLSIMIIIYTYYKLYSNESYYSNTGLKLAQNNLKKARVIWIYNAAASGKPVDKTF